nr:hypothetical protein Clen_238 [Cedratvirus lena]
MYKYSPPMDSVILQVLLSSQPREILLHSLVNPGFFTKQTWKLLCRQVLFSSWLDYKHVSKNPRRRFVEIACRKGLQGETGGLYSEEYRVLFAIFKRDLQNLKGVIERFPEETNSLFFKLRSKKERFFFQRELCLIEQGKSLLYNSYAEVIAEAEERKAFLLNSWDVVTRLLINGDQRSLEILEGLFFPKVSLGGKRADSCSLSLSELVLQDRRNKYKWLQAYSFSKDDCMIEKLFALNYSSLNRSHVREIARNLCTSGNLSLIYKLEKEYTNSAYFEDGMLSFEEKLHCLTNYYLFTGDDRGFYHRLLEVMGNKSPITGETNIIFEVELYEVRDLLKREGLENPLTKNFL